jgi:hypothetical protein
VPERGEHLLLFDDEHPGREGRKEARARSRIFVYFLNFGWPLLS